MLDVCEVCRRPIQSWQDGGYYLQNGRASRGGSPRHHACAEHPVVEPGTRRIVLCHHDARRLFNALGSALPKGVVVVTLSTGTVTVEVEADNG